MLGNKKFACTTRRTLRTMKRMQEWTKNRFYIIIFHFHYGVDLHFYVRFILLFMEHLWYSLLSKQLIFIYLITTI